MDPGGDSSHFVKRTEGKTIADTNGDALPSAVCCPFRYPKTGIRAPKGPYSVLRYGAGSTADKDTAEALSSITSLATIAL